VKRFLHALAALLVFALASGLWQSGAVYAQKTPETGAPETPDGGPAIDDLVACMSTSRHLLVQFVIDESASLTATDPDDRRVVAAMSALDSLLTLATAEGAASPAIEVSFGAFANEFRIVQEWTKVGDDTGQELRTSLQGFADLNNGTDTDFVNALDGANDSLIDRSAEVTEAGGTPPCRAVLMFTDGGFDLAVRSTDEEIERLGLTKPYAPGIELTDEDSVQKAEAAGRAALCDPGGLADQIRRNEITMLTLALSGDIPRRAQLPLAAATTGRADDYFCGTPTDRPTGAYMPASGIDVLLSRFNEVGTRLGGGTPVEANSEVKICGKDPCDDGTLEFSLDETLRRVQIFALAGEPGAVVRIEGPSGTKVDIEEPGETKIGDTPVVARDVDGRGLTIDIQRPEDLKQWEGDWKVSLLDPTDKQKGKAGHLQVFVFSDISIEITAKGVWFRGSEAKVEATLGAPSGVDLSALLKTSEVELIIEDPVTLKQARAKLSGPPAGPFTGTYAIPSDMTTNSVNVSVSSNLTTTRGVKLFAQSKSQEVLLQRPRGSVQFLPPSLQMPSLSDAGTTTATITLQPGDGAGCVWFGKVEVPAAPEGAAPFELTIDGKALPNEQSCIKVPAGSPTTINLEVSPASKASGTVRGWVQVYEKVDGREGSTVTDLSFRFDMSRGIDQARRALLTVGLLIGGLALPMVLLLIINTVTARFQNLTYVRGAALPVRVAEGGVFKMDGAYESSLSLKESDFSSLAGKGTDRSFTFGGVTFRAKAARNPFAATVALASPEGGAEKLKGHAGSKVELDPGLAGSWVFLLDPDKTRRGRRGTSEGLLIAFIAEGDMEAQTRKMLPDIQKRLPKVADHLATLLRGTPAKPAKGSKASNNPDGESSQ